MKALGLLKKEPGGNSYRVLQHSGPFAEAATAIRFRTFRLRQLSTHERLDTLIFHAAAEGIVNWTDTKKLKGFARDLVWLAMAVTPTSNELELRRHLQTPFLWRKYSYHGPDYERTQRPDETYCRLCIAEEGLYYAAEQSSDNADFIEIMARAYGEAWPECRGFLPMSLMSLGLKFIDGETQRARRILAVIAGILPSSGEGQINTKSLLGTCTWEINRWEHKPEDLLLRFYSSLEQIAQGDLIKATSYAATRQFVKDLIDKRNALVEHGSSGD